MKSFFNRGRARCTAAAMLFVWLLALGTGIANACLAQVDHARHGHLSHHDTVLTALPVTALDAMAVDHASVEGHPGAIDHTTSPGKMACQNFCAAEQTGVVKQKIDAPAHLDAAQVLASMGWVAPPLADRAFPMPALADPPWTEPPVFIRFLRLTI